jgi:hypothetical protein
MRQNMPTSRDVLKMVIKGIKTDSLAYEMSLLSRLVYIIYLHRTNCSVVLDSQYTRSNEYRTDSSDGTIILH